MDSSEAEELSGAYVLTVDELGCAGLWDSVKEVFEARSPLQQITLHNKVGRAVQLDKLPIQFVHISDKRLLRLKPFSHSQVVWFRNPYVHIVLVSSADMNEYRAHIKAQVRKALADVEREWGGPMLQSEWMVVYIRPQGLDPQDKGASKVYDKLMDDFGAPALFSSSQRAIGPRVVGLSLPPRRGTGQLRGVKAYGLEELDHTLHARVRTAFEDRQAGYVNEIKSLSNKRQDPGWSFAMFYLVKDSFGLMLEMAGMWADALQEYVELETCYSETLSRDTAANSEFGSTTGESCDVATLMTAPWRQMRRAVLKHNTVPEFGFRQYLFASQSRLLLRMGRPLDTAERGVRFIVFMGQLLEQHLAAHPQLPGFKEAWVFSACMSLIAHVIAAAVREFSGAEHESSLNSGSSGSGFGSNGMARVVVRRARGGSTGSLPSMQNISGVLPEWSAVVVAPDKDGDGAPAQALQLHDWHLGMCPPADLMPPYVDPSCLGAAAIQPTRSHLITYSRKPDLQSRDTTYCKFFLALGHLYNLARQQLGALGKIAHPIAPHTTQRQQQQQQQEPGCWPEELVDQGLFSEFMGHYTGSSDFETRFEATPSSAHFTQQQVLMSMLNCGPPSKQPLNRHSIDHGLAGTLSEGANAVLSRLPKAPDIVRSTSGHDAGLRRVSNPEEAVPPMTSISSSPNESSPPPPDLPHSTDPTSSPLRLYLSPTAAPGSSHAAQGLGPLPSALVPASAAYATSHAHAQGPGSALTFAAAAPAAQATVPQHCGYHVYCGAATSRQLPAGGGLRSSSSSSSTGGIQGEDMSSAQQVSGGGAAQPSRHLHLVPEVKAPSLWASPPNPVLLCAMEPATLEDLTLSLGQHSARQRPFFPGAAAAAKAAGFPHLEQPASLSLSAQQRTAPSTSTNDATAAATSSNQTGEDGGAGSNTAGAAAASAGASPTADALTLPGHMAWVSDWRLRAALSSTELWQDLMLQLRVVGAVCLSNAGRPRNAALLWADVGLLALNLGHLRLAHRLLENLCMTAAFERWHALLSCLLPHMIWCQSMLGHVMLPFTCLRYLGLPAEDSAPSTHSQAVLDLLLRCLHPPGGLSPWAQAGIQIHAMHALLVTPASGRFSWFYGAKSHTHNSSTLHPSTSRQPTTPTAGSNSSSRSQWESLHPAPCRFSFGPRPQGVLNSTSEGLATYSGWDAHSMGSHVQQQQPQQEPPEQGQNNQAAAPGARLVHAGELVLVAVDVWSNLPAPLALTNLSLVLRTLVHTYAVNPPHPLHPSGPTSTTAGSQHQQQHPTGSVDAMLDPSPAALSSQPPPTHPTHHHRHHSTGHTRPPPSSTLLVPTSSMLSSTAPHPPHLPTTSIPFHNTPAAPLSHDSAQHSHHGPSISSSASGQPSISEPISTHTHSTTHTTGSSNRGVDGSSASATQGLSNRGELGAVGSPSSSRPALPSARRTSFDAPVPRTTSHGSGTAVSGGPSYYPLHLHLHNAPGSGLHQGPDHPPYTDAYPPHTYIQKHRQGAPGSEATGSGEEHQAQAGGSKALGRVRGPDLECGVLLKVEQLGGAVPCVHHSSDAAAGSSPQGTAVVEGCMARPLGVAVLHPGWSRLTFLAAPVVPGLCLVSHLTALLGTCTLHVQATPPHSQLKKQLQPPPHSIPAPPPPPQSWSNSAWSIHSEHTTAGAVGLGGNVNREAVVLAVADVQTRMATSAVALEGSLVAGAQQWLGVALVPCQDAPSRLRLAVLPRTKGLLRVGDHFAQPAEDLLLAVGPGGAMQGGLGRPGTSAAIQKSQLEPSSCGAPGLRRRRKLWGLHPACVWDSSASWPANSQGSVSEDGADSVQGGEGAGGSCGVNEAVAESCLTMLAPLLGVCARGDGQHHLQQQQLPTEQRHSQAWCKLLRGCIELHPRLLGHSCLQQPALLWLPVCVPPLLGWQSQPELVQVEHSTDADAAAQASQPGAAESRKEVRLKNGPVHPEATQPTAELDVALEYQGSDSCWRSHTSMLSIPVRQPFRVSSKARALKGSTVLLSMSLHYQGVQAAVVQDVCLAPQDSCQVVSAAAPGLLPACLHPGTDLTLSFVLSMGVQYTAGGATEDGDVGVNEDMRAAAAALAMAKHFGIKESRLTVTYGVATDAPYTSRSLEVVSHGRQPLLHASHPEAQPLPLPPLLSQHHHASPAKSSLIQPTISEQQSGAFQGALNVASQGSAACGAITGGSSVARGESRSAASGTTPEPTQLPLVFSWAIRLQGPSPDNAAASKHSQLLRAVHVRFLGPLLAQVGVPTTLAWQVTRVCHAGSAQGTSAGSNLQQQNTGASRAIDSAHGSTGGNRRGVTQGSSSSTLDATQSEEGDLVCYDLVQPYLPAHSFPSTHWGGSKPSLQPWTLTASSRGVLRLGGQHGAVGVVETVVAPAAAGTLPPPSLHFRDVGSVTSDPAQPYVTILPGNLHV